HPTASSRRIWPAVTERKKKDRSGIFSIICAASNRVLPCKTASFEFWLLPPARFRRTKNRVDDGHVPDRFLQRNRLGLVFANAPRKEIRLDRVLIADFQLD